MSCNTYLNQMIEEKKGFQSMMTKVLYLDNE